jgi:hypothetical protein
VLFICPFHANAIIACPQCREGGGPLSKGRSSREEPARACTAIHRRGKLEEETMARKGHQPRDHGGELKSV